MEGQGRAFGAQKKSLSDALDHAAQSGKTSHAMIHAVSLARLINLQCGGAVIAPWEIDQLDDEWIAVFTGLAEDLPRYRESHQAFERKLAEIRRRHPTYRKYLS